MRSIEPPNPREEGFILIAVLASLILLAMIALLLSRTVALDAKVTAYIARRAEAEAQADGIARLAIRHLVVNGPKAGMSGPIHLDGIPAVCQSGEFRVVLSFIDTSGQININSASEELLQRLFTGVGLPTDAATSLAQDVIDFRSIDDTSVRGGSKLELYQAAGLSHGPKNEPFEIVGELAQLPGMTPALLHRLRPLVTVHSRFSTVNPAVASLPVLMALSGSGEEPPALPDPRALDDLRTRISLPRSLTSVARTRSSSTGPSLRFAIRVTMLGQYQSVFAREAVIELAPTEPSGAKVLAWEELEPAPAEVPPLQASDAPACIGGVLWIER